MIDLLLFILGIGCAIIAVLLQAVLFFIAVLVEILKGLFSALRPQQR